MTDMYNPDRLRFTDAQIELEETIAALSPELRDRYDRAEIRKLTGNPSPHTRPAVRDIESD